VKVALIVPGGVDRSGVERVIPCILWLIERLVAAGDDVHVFAFNQESRPGRWRLLGATVHNAGQRPQTVTTLAMIAAEHTASAFDIFHAFWADSCGVVGAVAAKLTRRRLILTLPGGDLSRIPSIGYGSMIRWQGRARVRFAVRGAHAITAPSQAMCALAEQAGIRAQRVPLGVALDRWPVAPPRPRNPRDPIRLLHVASLNRVKDQYTLLAATRILRDAGVAFELTVVGADTLGGAIQRHAAELDLSENVRFLGFIPHHALRSWIDRADILVMSSHHEAGPLVTLEAAIAGVPTVGTAVGHIADFAPEAAIAVRVGDAAALANGVRCLADNEQSRLRLALNAQVRACLEDADFTARSFKGLYDEATARQPCT
jgi:glycosyltransferase involved in cell wall biosynthesis